MCTLYQDIRIGNCSQCSQFTVWLGIINEGNWISGLAGTIWAIIDLEKCRLFVTLCVRVNLQNTGHQHHSIPAAAANHSLVVVHWLKLITTARKKKESIPWRLHCTHHHVMGFMDGRAILICFIEEKAQRLNRKWERDGMRDRWCFCYSDDNVLFILFVHIKNASLRNYSSV